LGEVELVAVVVDGCGFLYNSDRRWWSGQISLLAFFVDTGIGGVGLVFIVSCADAVCSNTTAADNVRISFFIFFVVMNYFGAMLLKKNGL